MKQLTFIKLAQKVLEEAGRPLSTEEIWEAAKAKGYDKTIGTQGKTPWRSIGAQVYVNMRDDKETPFITVGSRPRRFYLKTLPASNIDIIEESPTEQCKEPQPKGSSYLEKDLHPVLAYFADHYLKVHAKTIQHSKSNKSECLSGFTLIWSDVISQLTIGKKR